MVEQLFGSKTRVKLLQLFFSNPNRPFYVREITRKIDEQINSVRRELANLLSAGIITSDEANNRLYYEVNQKYEFYDPLSQIFGGRSGKKAGAAKTAPKKEEPAVEPQDDTYKMLGNVELVLYTGQFTRDDRPDVDILLVGDLNHTQVQKFIDNLEKQEKKEIRYAVMPTSEFTYRRQINDRFISDVITSKHQLVLDKPGLLNTKK